MSFELATHQHSKHYNTPGDKEQAGHESHKAVQAAVLLHSERCVVFFPSYEL
jgi:hypothetical protein